ncbi:MAG: flagellar biosynthetic protein FliO [Lachnospiraceae bacterium]|nr:flagellar biosynthetic protein FliO [Lachnospiraceae bacterium]
MLSNLPVVATAGSGDSYIEFITICIIFIGVLALTLYVTKWIAKYQRVQNAGKNMEIIEAVRIDASKYMQLVRVGETYFVIAVCKDTVTMLTEVPVEQLKFSSPEESTSSAFDSLLEKAKQSLFKDKQE